MAVNTLIPLVTAAAPHLLTLSQTAAEKACEKIAESHAGCGAGY